MFLALVPYTLPPEHRVLEQEALSAKMQAPTVTHKGTWAGDKTHSDQETLLFGYKALDSHLSSGSVLIRRHRGGNRNLKIG